ncbi:uncharacterized protein H6S33_002880 [Morchella sextelata]|uniref:uncharacterized protein n=1 Tax=Morchella sextelata TaxID=1174677 RepID=UPI001D0573DA|nr:uncharacterized protein H6S33_002880 [Morchella sextelata]KAH0607846.1 hypothetical protein H6S33_002880 [Morchella sextelata]
MDTISTPSSSADTSHLLLAASNSLTTEALVTRDPSRLRAALALAITASHHGQSAGHSSLPPSAYHYMSRLRFEHFLITQNAHDLLEAIAQLEAPAATPLPPALERALSDYYTNLFSLTDTAQLVFPAIDHGYLALRCTSPEHPSYRRRLQTLAFFHHQRWRGYAVEVGDLETDPAQDLNLAIKIAGAALNMKKKPGRSRREVLEAIRMHTGKGVSGRPLVNAEEEEQEEEEEEEEEEEDAGALCRNLRINLGIYHSERYNLRKSPTDLDMAIAYAEEVLAELSKSNCNSDDSNNIDSGTRFILGGLLTKRYQLTKDPNDLTAAIELITDAKNSVPSNHPNAITYLWDLCKMLRERYKRLKCEDDLHTALGHATALTRLTDPLWESWADLLLLTALFLGQRFELKGERGDIDTAIDMCRDGLEMARKTEVEYRRGDLLRRLLHKRFHRFGDVADLDSAIDDAETELSKLVPGSDEHRMLQMELRGHEYERRNRWGPAGRAEGEDDYRKLQQEAADLAGSRNAGVLGGLAARFFARWQNTHDPEALRMAVAFGRSAAEANDEAYQAAEEEGEGGGDRRGRGRGPGPYTSIYGSLGTYLEVQSQHLTSLDDLEEAIELTAREMSLTPDDPHTLMGLTTKLIHRYEHTSAEFDLEAAIATSNVAAACAPAPHPLRPSVLLALSQALGLRYERTSDSADLESAITAAKEALDLTPPGGFSRVGLMVGIGELIGLRYDSTDAVRDLNLTVELAEAAVKACPPDRPEYAGLLISQGFRCLKLYRRLNKLDDLKKAQALMEKSLAQMHSNNPWRTKALFHLNVIHLLLHRETNDPAHLALAIEMNELCAETMPPGHLKHAELNLMLARARLALYEDHTHDDGDLALAIECAEMAVEASVPTLGADAHLTLAACLMAPNIEEEGLRAAQAYIKGWESVLSRPRTRVYCARQAAALLAMSSMWEEASKMADEAVMLLPRMNPRSMERGDQQEALKSVAGIGAVAATLALQADRGAGHALRMLEFGRGVMLGYTIDNRSDMSDLRTSHPELADRFEKLRRALDSPVQDESEQELGTLLAAAGGRRYYGTPRRQRLVNGMDELLGEIRGIEGHEGFLLPPGEETMMKLAESGPVVVVNPGFRNDAIIITTAGIKSIALPKLDEEGLDSIARRLEEMRGLVEGPIATYKDRNEKMGPFLLWLWDAVVEPTLEELQIHAPSPEIESNAALLPHIWWIGVGALSSAPFHAAGDHSPGSNRNTISRVVSSYIPTLKALSYARQKAPTATSLTDNEKDEKKKNPDSQHSLLLVTMDTTPGEGQLKKVTKEAANLKVIAEGAGAKATVLPQPSASRVLDELQRYDVMHFACHGVTDSADPSKSALLLLSEDGKSVSRLLVEKVAAINSLRAWLAYLSACKTADSGEAVELADESIHLAGAFQLAGFAHVVATMWTGGDRACMEVAEDFYKGLYRVGGHGNVGREVHAAVRKLREKKPGKYLQWAPFIHTGP